MSLTDKQVASIALIRWRNMLQTGDPYKSIQDAINVGEIETCRMLTHDQQEFVIRLEELAEELAQGGSI